LSFCTSKASKLSTGGREHHSSRPRLAQRVAHSLGKQARLATNTATNTVQRQKPQIRIYLPAHVSIRQHTPAHVSIRHSTPAYVSIREKAEIGTWSTTACPSSICREPDTYHRLLRQYLYSCISKGNKLSTGSMAPKLPMPSALQQAPAASVFVLLYQESKESEYQSSQRRAKPTVSDMFPALATPARPLKARALKHVD
jgi:hypothetical protein